MWWLLLTLLLREARKCPNAKGIRCILLSGTRWGLNFCLLCVGRTSLTAKTETASDLKVSASLNLTFCDKCQAKTTTDEVLFLLCTVYDILSSVYSSFHGCAKSSCSCRVAAQPAYIMSPFSDRFIDFALPSAPSLKLFNTRTNWDRYFPTAQNRSLANWKRWTLSPTDLYKRLGEMERGEILTICSIGPCRKEKVCLLFCALVIKATE